MKQAKFVERRKKATVFYNQSLTRSRTCYGAKLFENGYVAYAEVAQVDVFDKDFALVERGFEDVFFFKSGESFVKELGTNEWVLRDSKRNEVTRGTNVLVLSSNLGAIEDLDGNWNVYLLGKDKAVYNVYSFPTERVINVKTYELENDRCLLVVCYGKSFTLFGFDFELKLEPFERKVDDYTFTHSGLLVVSEHGSLLDVNKTDCCSLVCASGGSGFRLFDNDFKQLYKQVTDVVSFKNGVYFVCRDNLWSFYTKSGTYFGGLSDLEICRCGAICGKESHTQERSLNIGRYDEKHVMVIQGEQTVVTDGDKIVSAINMHFSDVAILE